MSRTRYYDLKESFEQEFDLLNTELDRIDKIPDKAKWSESSYSNPAPSGECFFTSVSLLLTALMTYILLVFTPVIVLFAMFHYLIIVLIGAAFLYLNFEGIGPYYM